MFKNLYGRQENSRFTEDMLECLYDLPEGSLKGMKIKNSFKLDKETISNKLYELDILIELKDKKQIILEVQTTYDLNAERKNIMYIAGIVYKSLHSGETMKDAHEIEGLMIIKHMNMKSRMSKKVKESYLLINENDLNNKMSTDIVKLTLVLLEYNCEYLELNVPKRFIPYMEFLSANTLEEQERAAKKRPILMEQYKECRRFMELDYIQNFDNDEKVIKARHMDELEEATISGKLEGEIHKAIETAKIMLSNNESLEKIIAYTGLTEKEIEEIKANLE